MNFFLCLLNMKECSEATSMCCNIISNLDKEWVVSKCCFNVFLSNGRIVHRNTFINHYHCLQTVWFKVLLLSYCFLWFSFFELLLADPFCRSAFGSSLSLEFACNWISLHLRTGIFITSKILNYVINHSF